MKRIHPLLWLAGFLLPVLLLNLAPPEASAETMRVFASVRTYKPGTAPSYHKLFEYDGKGNRVRPLTERQGLHDINPMLSPDGRQLVFERIAPADWRSDEAGFYIARRLDPFDPEPIEQPPNWYEPVQPLYEDQTVDIQGWETGIPVLEAYLSPDGRYEILINYWKSGELEGGDQSDGFSAFTNAWVDDYATSPPTSIRLRERPGFECLTSTWLVRGTPFYFVGPLELAFMRCYLGAGDGAATYVLDLTRMRLHQVAANDGRIVPLDDRPGFFVVSEEWYQDLPDGGTVRCSYLDYWGSELERVRFSAPLSAFGGAAVRFGDGTQITLPTREKF